MALLVYAAISDLRTMHVHDWVTVALVVVAVGSKLAGWHPVTWPRMLLGGAVPLVFFAIMLWWDRESFGMADVQLLAAIGLLVGFPGVVLVAIATIIAGGIMGAFFLARRRRPFPYVPAIAAGLLVFALVFEYQRFQSLR